MAIKRDEFVESMLEGMITLKTSDECYNFLKDLCTIREIKSMAQRYFVARMLTEGKVYSEIVEKTGASTATISRVNRSINDGAEGYSVVFSRLKGEDK